MAFAGPLPHTESTLRLGQTVEWAVAFVQFNGAEDCIILFWSFKIIGRIYVAWSGAF